MGASKNKNLIEYIWGSAGTVLNIRSLVHCLLFIQLPLKLVWLGQLFDALKRKTLICDKTNCAFNAEKAKAQLEIHPGSTTNILPNTCLLQFVQILAFVCVALFKLSLDSFYKLRGLHSKPWEQPTETETSRHSSPQTSDTNFSEQTAERIRIIAA